MTAPAASRLERALVLALRRLEDVAARLALASLRLDEEAEIRRRRPRP